MTWTYEESEYQFKLPTIVGNLHSLNETLTYDATCLEIFETSFDDYIHHHPKGYSFPFKKEVVIQNMKGVLDYLQNVSNMKSSINEETFMSEGRLGNPQKGYVYKIVLERSPTVP